MNDGRALIHLRPPRATQAILVAIVVYYLMTMIAGGPGDLAVLVAFGANFRALVYAGEFWRLVTSIFLHGGFLHLAVNGYALFVLGRNLEAFYGPWKLIVLFLGSGLVGSIASAALSEAISVGASGGIFGLLGASIVFAFRYRNVLPRRITWIMGTALLPWVGVNIALGLIVPRIDMNAHLGGLLGGAVIVGALVPDALIEVRKGAAPAVPRFVASLCLAVLLVSFGAAGLNVLRMRGDDGLVLDERVMAVLGDYDRREMLRQLEEELSGHPDDPELLFLRAQVRTLAGDWDEALADYRALLATTPDDVRVLNNLAWVLLEEVPEGRRDRAEAERLARRAVELAPEDPYALGTFGTARLRAGDAEAAALLFERALRTRRPEAEEATDRYLLALALHRLGRTEEARAELNYAIRRDDDNDYREEVESELREIQSAPSP